MVGFVVGVQYLFECRLACRRASHRVRKWGWCLPVLAGPAFDDVDVDVVVAVAAAAAAASIVIGVLVVP